MIQAMKNIHPCLWFNGNARKAAQFYCGIFKHAKITSETPTVVHFEVNGQKIMALNGGPHFQFNEAVSFVVECDNQEELDYYWEKLTAGGEESMFGWLKDKFGLSWQIVPKVLGELMADPQRSPRVMQAFLKMKKFDIATLLKA